MPEGSPLGVAHELEAGEEELMGTGAPPQGHAWRHVEDSQIHPQSGNRIPCPGVVCFTSRECSPPAPAAPQGPGEVSR